MKIVFPVFVANASKKSNEGIWGEELIANRYRDMLKYDGQECDVVAVKELEDKYDVAVWSSYNLTHPIFLKNYAEKNILWIQGFNYQDDKIVSLDDIYNACKPYYDLIITSARGLATKYNIPFVIPAIDFTRYFGTEKKDFLYDVSFIGNIIKPWETNSKFLTPMGTYNYGLFGGDFGKLDHEDWLKTVWGSKVNVHYGFDEGIKWDMVTGSPLFLAACGAFCLSDKIPWFMETFKDAMAFTDGGDDEKEKIKYYLENEEEREKMASRAYSIVRELDYNAILPIIKGV